MNMFCVHFSENIKKLKLHITGSWKDVAVGGETWEVFPEPAIRETFEERWKTNKDDLL